MPQEQLVEELLHRIRSQLYHRGAHVWEVFSGLDTKNKGKLPLNRVESALSSGCGCVLTAADYQLLQAAFKPEYEPWEAPPPEVAWQPLARSLDAVYKPDLVTDNTTRVREFVPCPNNWETVQKPQRGTVADLSREEMEQLYTVMCRLSHLCIQRRVDVEAMFRKDDIRNNGLIQAKELKNILSLVNFQFKAQQDCFEYETLLKAYSHPGPEVNYKLLVRHLKQFLHPHPSFIVNRGAPGALNMVSGRFSDGGKATGAMTWAASRQPPDSSPTPWNTSGRRSSSVDAETQRTQRLLPGGKRKPPHRYPLVEPHDPGETFNVEESRPPTPKTRLRVGSRVGW